MQLDWCLADQPPQLNSTTDHISELVRECNGYAPQLWSLNKARNRQLVRLAPTNSLEGVAVISSREFYASATGVLAEVC